MNPLNILISTGIYPPDLGGPAEYAKNIEKEFGLLGNSVTVKYFKLEKILPSVIRHFFYFFRILNTVKKSDLIVVLDTFSVALPTVLAAKIFKKKTIIRTGGDFLWESYVERTGEKVLFTRFYKTRKSSFNLKEKIIFYLTRWVLKNVSVVVFSTNWQREIFLSAYDLDKKKTFIIENFYGPRIVGVEKKKQEKKVFLCATRPIKFKNRDILEKAFLSAQRFDNTIILDKEPVSHNQFLEKIKNSWAVILTSLGDISPNMILDAISVGTPFILTRECGIYERIKNIGVFVDPLSVEDIRDKILFLSNEQNYNLQKRAVENFTFTHSWRDICREFLNIYRNIK